MGEDASLDDFLDAADDQEAEPIQRDEETGDEAELAGDDTADGGAITDGDTDQGEDPVADPARATYDWTPSGAACEACGETVERRWRDEPGFVCENCKDW